MDLALIDETSLEYLGQWRRLVSTTNWEKGQIIHNWREALRLSGTPAVEYSDEAWSRRVGNVTPQHVGRLRRAYDRFHAVRGDYPGLYWSHFQAALDWDDAEMWLEGASQNDWSISEMRSQRWETRGELALDQSEAAEDFTPWDEDGEAEVVGDVVGGTLDEVRSPEQDTAREEEDEEAEYDRSEFDGEREEAQPAREAIRPFASLPPLPADVNDAFETYKLCILRHKLAGWQEISREDLLISLDSLKQLALAPAEM